MQLDKEPQVQTTYLKHVDALYEALAPLQNQATATQTDPIATGIESLHAFITTQSDIEETVRSCSIGLLAPWHNGLAEYNHHTSALLYERFVLIGIMLGLENEMLIEPAERHHLETIIMPYYVSNPQKSYIRQTLEIFLAIGAVVDKPDDANRHYLEHAVMGLSTLIAPANTEPPKGWTDIIEQVRQAITVSSPRALPLIHQVIARGATLLDMNPTEFASLARAVGVRTN